MRDNLCCFSDFGFLQVMYHPYMAANAVAGVVERHEKLAAKGAFIHERIRANIAPVLQTRAMNSKPVNRWNPNGTKQSLLKRTTGNIFFDYVRTGECRNCDRGGWGRG